jgi:hypothetical protein
VIIRKFATTRFLITEQKIPGIFGVMDMVEEQMEEQ